MASKNKSKLNWFMYIIKDWVIGIINAELKWIKDRKNKISLVSFLFAFVIFCTTIKMFIMSEFIPFLISVQVLVVFLFSDYCKIIEVEREEERKKITAS